MPCVWTACRNLRGAGERDSRPWLLAVKEQKLQPRVDERSPSFERNGRSMNGPHRKRIKKVVSFAEVADPAATAVIDVRFRCTAEEGRAVGFPHGNAGQVSDSRLRGTAATIIRIACQPLQSVFIRLFSAIRTLIPLPLNYLIHL